MSYCRFHRERAREGDLLTEADITALQWLYGAPGEDDGGVQRCACGAE